MKLATAIKPTAHQRCVLAIIASSPTAQVAGGLLNDNNYIHTAAKMLARMGLINYDGVSAEMTPAGEELAANESITDAGGGISDEAAALIKQFLPSQPGNPMAESVIQELLGLC